MKRLVSKTDIVGIVTLDGLVDTRVDRREFRPVTFADAEPQLRSILYQRKTESEYVKWLDVLREQTFIERKGAFAAGGFDG